MSEQTAPAALPLVLGAAFRPISAAQDEAAAAILAAATGEGTVRRGRERLAEARADEESAAYGLTVGGELVAAYVLRRAHLSMELAAVAVAEGHRGRGYGRAALADALRRSGNRPLVAETDDEGLGFYKACGFKLVGRRTGPGGTPRYRLGWHAPRRQPKNPVPAGRAEGAEGAEGERGGRR